MGIVGASVNLWQRHLVLSILLVSLISSRINPWSSSCVARFGESLCHSFERWRDGFPLILSSRRRSGAPINMTRNIYSDLDILHKVKPKKRHHLGQITCGNGHLHGERSDFGPKKAFGPADACMDGDETIKISQALIS